MGYNDGDGGSPDWYVHSTSYSSFMNSLKPIGASVFVDEASAQGPTDAEGGGYGFGLPVDEWL